MSQDPFARGATLSADEARQLIQLRVTACSGDGEALFPPETCTEIHRHAGGDLEAITTLARESMRLAAEGGSSPVLPAHVEAAVLALANPGSAHDAEDPGGFLLPQEPSSELPPEAKAWVASFLTHKRPVRVWSAAGFSPTGAGSSASASASRAAAALDRPAAEPQPASTEAPEPAPPAESVEPVAPAPAIATHAESPADSHAQAPPAPASEAEPRAEAPVAQAPAHPQEPQAEAPTHQAPSQQPQAEAPRPAPQQARAAAPPNPPALAPAVGAQSARVTRPSPQDAGRSGQQRNNGGKHHNGQKGHNGSKGHNQAKGGNGKGNDAPQGSAGKGNNPNVVVRPAEPDHLKDVWAPVRTSQGHVHSRSNNTVGATGVTAIAAIVLILIFIVIQLRPKERRVETPGAKPSASATTESGAPTTAPVPAPGAPIDPVPESAAPKLAPRATPSSPPSQPVVEERRRAAEPVPTSPVDVADSAPREAEMYGLEVGSFIVPSRAKGELQRLVRAGQPVRILTEWDDGAEIYRVVVGSFRSRGAAERAADALLSDGIVNQARVVTLKSEH